MQGSKSKQIFSGVNENSIDSSYGRPTAVAACQDFAVRSSQTRTTAGRFPGSNGNKECNALYVIPRPAVPRRESGMHAGSALKDRLGTSSRRIWMYEYPSTRHTNILTWNCKHTLNNFMFSFFSEKKIIYISPDGKRSRTFTDRRTDKTSVTCAKD